MFQINQENLRLLLPGKVSWMVEYMTDDYGYSLQECLNRIYRSELYKKLSTESTKYWHLGPVDLYKELKEELQNKGELAAKDTSKKALESTIAADPCSKPG